MRRPWDNSTLVILKGEKRVQVWQEYRERREPRSEVEIEVWSYLKLMVKCLESVVIAVGVSSGDFNSGVIRSVYLEGAAVEAVE